MISSAVIRPSYPFLGKMQAGPKNPLPGKRYPQNAGVNREELQAVLAKNLQGRMDANPAIGTQLLLEAKSGVGQSTISRILLCQTFATLDSLAGLATACGCEAWELLLDEEQTRAEIVRRFLGKN